MNKTTKTLLALAVGSLAGFVTGILVAPKRGEETIEDIKDTWDKTSRDLTERASKFRADIEAQTEKAVRFLEEQRDSLGKKLAEEDVTTKAKGKVKTNGEPVTK